jgi:TPR repeat protein
MSFTKTIIGLTLSMLLASGIAVAADFNKGLEAAQSGDFKTALAEMAPLAVQGNASAQTFLGIVYDDGGYGVPENDKTAVKWYTLAAEQGDTISQNRLARMYADGEGVLENDKTAVKWYTLAAKQGHAMSQFSLGFMYSRGYGVLADNRRAYMWYSIASYNGNETAAKNKDIRAKQMTPADISKAQDMSSRCLESNYTDC